MYTKNDFPVGSKARVIATGEVVVVSAHQSHIVFECEHTKCVNKTVITYRIEELEPVFEYGEDVEVSDNGKKWHEANYGCKILESDSMFSFGKRHIVFNTEAFGWTYCRRANSRKSELLKQLEQAREEERKAVEKREELEKELEKIK